MEPPRQRVNRGRAVWVPFVSLALLMVSCAKVESVPQVPSGPTRQPDLSATGNLFSCLTSSSGARGKKRTAILHGTDWVLESSVRPACFPAREVVFSVETGGQFNVPVFTARTRLFVTTDRLVTYVRIVDSSGEDQDMIAVGLVTNHKCSNRTSKNCRIVGGGIPRVEVTPSDLHFSQ
jgi:hypothetical protein